MTLNEYLNNQPFGFKKQFANEMGITSTWLGLISQNKKRPSASLAKQIERATNRVVRAKTLRPDLFN